ncbi:MAG TPA: PP2C family protein-serine/threonine phosphatase [Tepidisphaeraceae bacterium]|jgi:sigma-B regulation protein RsbU (phosphoserine phosphatase)|nr:PP2C family protein-serine/threonine phosphatase [Tepidisphaeraceae bacterium]
MKADDLSTNVHVATLARLRRELQHSRTPVQTLRTVRQAMADLYGPVASLMLSTRGLGAGEYRVVEIRSADADPGESSDPWSQGGAPVYRGGVIARMIDWPGPRVFREVDWSDDPYFHDVLAGFDSAAAIPFADERLPLDWLVLLREGPGSFAGDDIDQTLLRAALVGSLLESQALVEELASAHASIDAEVRRVGQIQRWLLPDPLPDIPGVQIAVSYETSTEAGGDLYDFIPLCPRAEKSDGVADSPGTCPWAIFIGDASGHGPSAAVVIAIVQALLHAHPPGITSPASLLKHLNDHLCERPVESSFVTAFLGVFDSQSHRLHFAGAGHPPPLLIRPCDPCPRRLQSHGGYPLGIDAGQTFEDQSIDLHSRDTLLLYTDGITESRNPAGDFFGIGGIESALLHDPGASNGPAQLIATVRRSIATHEHGQRIADDQTLVAIAVT